jgi:hypothetical protein
MKKTTFSRVRYAWPALALLVVMLLSACGGGGTGSNSNTASIDYSGTITTVANPHYGFISSFAITLFIILAALTYMPSGFGSRSQRRKEARA